MLIFPTWRKRAAPPGAKTKEEALGNIREVAQMVIESMLEDGEPMPPGVTEMNETSGCRHGMSVDYSRFRSLPARRLASALHDDGFELSRQKGSHRHYRHAHGRRVTLSFHHSSDTFWEPSRALSRFRPAGGRPICSGSE